MALNQPEIQRIEDAELDGLYSDHLDLWHELATNAYQYVANYVDEVRVDDVILALEPALAVTDTLQDFLQENRLRQKYWNRYFGDYILDQLWDQLVQEAEESEEEDDDD